MSVYRRGKEVEEFHKIIKNIKRGISDFVMVNRWKTIYNKLCDMENLVVYTYRSRHGAIYRCICRNEETVDLVKNSRFIKERIIGKVTPEGRMELCELLMFPPKASEAFAYKLYPESTQIKVNYQGFSFTSFESTIVEDMEWLMENIKPKIKG